MSETRTDFDPRWDGLQNALQEHLHGALEVGGEMQHVSPAFCEVRTRRKNEAVSMVSAVVSGPLAAELLAWLRAKNGA